MNETPFFFPHDEHQLFGILHRPAVFNGHAFVFCHPFAEEKLWTHRIYVSYARALCAAGYAVLRFDYMGHGDSSGHFEDSTVQSRLADIACAVEIVKQKMESPETIGLLGLRFGATLAALAVDMIPEINPLVMWEPIGNGAQYMKELIRINLTTQTAVYKEVRFNTDALVAQLQEGGGINIDGYEIRYPLYEQMTTIKFTGRQSSYDGKCLLVQINKADGMGTKRIEPVASRFREAKCKSVVEQPFWKEIKEYYANAGNLFDLTTKWIAQNA